MPDCLCIQTPAGYTYTHTYIYTPCRHVQICTRDSLGNSRVSGDGAGLYWIGSRKGGTSSLYCTRTSHFFRRTSSDLEARCALTWSHGYFLFLCIKTQGGAYYRDFVRLYHDQRMCIMQALSSAKDSLQRMPSNAKALALVGHALSQLPECVDKAKVTSHKQTASFHHQFSWHQAWFCWRP